MRQSEGPGFNTQLGSNFFGVSLLSHILPPSLMICMNVNCTCKIVNTVDREIFARENIGLLNFRIVLFSMPQHTGSVASFLLFDVEKYSFHHHWVPTKIY